MSEVKRFIDVNDCVEEFSEGPWVSYEDYAELKAQVIRWRRSWLSCLIGGFISDSQTAAKNQSMKCRIAWSDSLNSVIYGEEGAPCLLSNGAFEIISAGEPS